jgi:hypothetical protein
MNVTVSEAAARRQFKVMQSAFEQAIEKNPNSLRESHYVFGGHAVRVRVVGREFAKQLSLPFSHLQLDAADRVDPRLTIDLLDENETNIRVNSTSAGAGSEKIVAMSPDGRFVGQRRPNSLSCYDREAGRIISSVAWGDQLSIYERAKPLDRPLLEWHNEQQIQIIHAALISRQNTGILFAGKSGSGKSTSALATCLYGRFNFLSEDFVGLQRMPDGSFVGHSIYNSVFLKTDHVGRFPILRPYVMKGMPHEEKCFVILSRVYPDRLKRTAPIRVLVLPRVADTPQQRFRRASKGEALLALAPSSFLQIPNGRLGVRGFDKIAQLVEQVPCYWLEVGGDLTSIGHRVEELLTELNLIKVSDQPRTRVVGLV